MRPMNRVTSYCCLIRPDPIIAHNLHFSVTAAESWKEEEEVTEKEKGQKIDNSARE